MSDASRWLAVAAEILNEPDHRRARQLLTDALLASTHAYVLARTRPEDDVELLPGNPWQDSAIWEEAVQSAAQHHPLYAFHDKTGRHEPALLATVMTKGWQLTEFGAAMIAELGFTRHQLTIPMSASAPARDAYGLVSETPYTERDLELARQIQPLLMALDRHVSELEAAASREGGLPAPGAVRLTPRERVILEQIARGGTVDGIAARLRISRRTVHKHQEHLYRKLGAVDRLSAVLSAQRLGLVCLPES